MTMRFDDLTGRLVGGGAGGGIKSLQQPPDARWESGVPASARDAQGFQKDQSERKLGWEAGPFLTNPLVPRCQLFLWDKARGYARKAAKQVMSVMPFQLANLVGVPDSLCAKVRVSSVLWHHVNRFEVWLAPTLRRTVQIEKLIPDPVAMPCSPSRS
jgi:hypothetical protein